MQHITVQENVHNLMEKLDFPLQSIQTLSVALSNILADSQASEVLDDLMSQYDKTEHCDYKQMIEAMINMCDKLSINEYQAGMLLFLSLGDRLLLRYRERGIDESVFYHTLMDLRYKLEECLIVKKRVGTFVPSWFAVFYNLSCFAIGRLQFQMLPLGTNCEINGVALSAESKALNVHIPRTGTKLSHDEVLNSYSQATKFFEEYFGDEPKVFMCSSWLLDPWHKEILSPDSNMMLFLNDYIIVETGEWDNYEYLWRVFDCDYNDNLDSLPQNTKLQYEYVKRIKSGQPLSWGKGVFIFE